MNKILFIDGPLEGDFSDVPLTEYILTPKPEEHVFLFEEIPIDYKMEYLCYKYSGVMIRFDLNKILLWSCYNKTIVGERAILKLIGCFGCFSRAINIPYEYIPWLTRSWAESNKVNLWLHSDYAILMCR